MTAGDAPKPSPRWSPRADALVITALGAPLLPISLLNGMLLRERVQGIALADPALGGDPTWRARPLILPLVVAAAAVGRLLLARRRWPLRRPLTLAYTIVLIVAVASVGAALVPAPAVFPR
ncbi:MAG TPA: hypothetical protein VKZ18_22595 [Polyangia bacterium]|nr:hypothetical protein [Polyangia bacterium]